MIQATRLLSVRLRFSPVIACAFMAVACAHAPSSKPPSGSADDIGKLGQAIAEYTKAAKHLDAFEAPVFDVEEDLGKFGDYPSPAFFAREKRMVGAALERIHSIRPETMAAKDRTAYRLFKEDIEVSNQQFDFPSELLSFTQMGNRLHEYLDSSSKDLTAFPFDSVKHYEAYLERSDGFPAYIDAQIALLRRGIKEKIVLSCEVAGKVPNTYKDGLEPVIEKNPFWRPVLFMPQGFSSSDRARLTEGFRKMVADKIIPGYRKFDGFFRKEYEPRCRQGFGIGSLPHGKEWYRYAIRASTNLDLNAADLHRLGLKEVKRIAAELEQVKNELGYRGSLHAFLRSLANDPKYAFKSPEEMFAAFAQIKSETAKKIPAYFNVTPKSDFQIVGTSNPEDAAGSYDGPTENIPYGRFVVNTKNLHSVPTYEATTLLMHETVPGHHFQLALAFEMKDKLSEYQRKLYGSNSFVEGWALYSEYLGNEMGMYSDPLQHLGNLNDEMLRAVRLVVDTGIHAMGWSHAKALAYMRAHLASDEKDMENEVNRYSVWPGQALGYKVGQLKIIELRRLAEKELGPKFDIREFHRVVIGNGTVSLNVLDSQVRDWIETLKSSDRPLRQPSARR